MMTSAQFPVSPSRSRSAGKKAPYSRLARAAIALAVCAALDPAYAQVGANTLPTGPKVNAGAATVGTVGNKMTVTQTTPKVSLGWESFSIGSRAAVQFVQPSSSSIALNRVLGSDPSWIFGSLSANGKVFLINSAGVVFAPGARLNVGGIVVSTLDMSDQDFMAGRYVFSGNSTASVVNRGSIITSPGGYAALIGADVANEGTISAPGGSVALAAGSRVTMDLAGDGLLSISVDAASVRAMASNTGLIQADGGRVIVSARAAEALAGTVLNQTGIIEARSASMRNGEIVLDGGTGGVNVAGTMDVSGSASGQGGGSIAIRGGDITSAGTLRANAGDNATAGSINVVAAGNLTLEGTSRIEARGANVMSQGGNVYLYASGNATAMPGQVIDISGGSVSGDGGSAEFSAANNASIAGTFLGTAAAGYRKGTLLIDPLTATLNTTTYSANTDVQAEDGIVISGDQTIDPTFTLRLLADHDDTFAGVAGTWDVAGGSGGTIGLGTITRTGTATIIGASNSVLELWAGGSNVAGGYAIGTAGSPLLVSMNGGSLYVNTSNPNQLLGGHVNISNTGVANAINLTGVDTGTNLNNFTLASTGTIEVSGMATVGGSVALTSTTGSILDTAGTGLITAPSVSLTAGASIGATGLPINLESPVISLDSQNDVYVATLTVPISDLTLKVNPAGGAWTYSVVDGSGTGLTNFIVQDTGTDLYISSLTGGTNINLSVTSQTGNVNIEDNAIVAGNGAVSITATAGSIQDNTISADGTAEANISTTGALTLIAQGAGFSIGGSGNDDLDVAGVTSLTLRTNNNAYVSGATTPSSISVTADPTVGAVDYSVILGTATVTIADVSNNLQVNSVTSSSPLAFSLTAPAGNINLVDGAISLMASGASSVVLAAPAGTVDDTLSAATSIFLTDPASTLTLSAATGIGTAGAGNELNTEVPQVSLTTTGGPINLSNTGSLTVTAFSNTGGGSTTIATTGATGPTALTIAANIAQSGAISLSAGESGDMNTGDHLTVNAGRTVQSTGSSVALAAGDNVVLGANSVVQASTSVGIAAGNANNDAVGGISMGNPSTVSAGTTATLSATTDITVSSVSAGTTASVTTTGGSIFDDTNDTTRIVAPTGVILSAVAGAVGALGNDIDINSASLTADVTGSLIVTNFTTPLTTLNLTLRPADAAATYTLVSTGLAFTVADGGTVLNVTNVTATGDLALSITNASAAASAVTVGTITTNAGAATISANNGALTLTGPMNSGLATLSASGQLILNGNITSAGASLTGTGVTQAGGSLVNAGAGDVLIDANDGTLSMAGTVTTTSASATAVRIIDTGAATIGNINAASGTVTLGGTTAGDEIAGDLNQTGGTLLKASTLIGNVTLQTNLINLNELATLGAFTSGTHFQLVDNNDAGSVHNGGLTVTGPVTTVNGDNTTAGTANIEISAITDANNNAGTINLFVDNISAHTAEVTQLLKDGDVKLSAINLGGTANILEAGAGDGGIDVRGNEISFTATNDVGALAGAGKIEIQSNSFSIASGGLGEVAQTGDVTLGSIVLAGDFSFSASGTIIVDAPMAVNGDTLLQATGPSSNIIVQKPMTRINDAAGFVTLEADNHIIFRNGADFVAATLAPGGSGATAVTLNSDHDANGGGAIYINAHSVIHSNNGAVVFGGGSGATANAIGKSELVGLNLMENGIVLEGKINAGAGPVTLRGQSLTGATGVSGVIVRDTNVADVPNDVTFSGPFSGPPPASVYVGGSPVTVGAPTTFSGSGDIVTTTSTGTITLLGSGDLSAGNTQGVLITASDLTVGGATITTVSGAINIEGTHVSASGPNLGGNVGVRVNNGAVISSTDTANTAGAVTILGVGASTQGNSDNGVVITSAGTTGLVRTTVSVDGAALNLVGTGGGGGGADSANVGVQILGGADVKSIGTGKVTLTGTGGATNGGGNLGIEISGENLALSDLVKSTVVRTTSTAATALRVDLVGTGGAGTGAGDGGILIGLNARVLTATGNVAMTGVGGAGSSGGVTGNNNFGVEIATTARVTTTSSGSIAVTGTGGLSNDGNNYGIKVTGGGVVESLLAAVGAGTITFTGTGGAGSGPSDTGILIDGASSKLSTTVGSISLTGTGGGGATSVTDTANYGIHVSNTAVVETLGAAQVTLDGTGSATANGGNNFGVWIDLAGEVRSTGGAQTLTAGKILIIGQGGLGTGLLDGGIGLASGGKVTTLDAEIEFLGDGGTDTTGAGQSHGIFVNGGQILTAGDGAILLTGAGGTSAGGSNHGIFTLGGALIESTTDNSLNPPAGTISLEGMAGVGAGGNNIGVAITGLSIVRSKDGFIDVFGTAAAAGASAGNIGVQVATDALITSTGLATIIIDGFGSTTGTGTAYGIQVASGAGITSTGTGTITLTGVGGGTASGGSDNYGLFVTGTGAADTKITSVTGNILLTGTGGGQGGASGNTGIVISAAADVLTTGDASIGITGQSGITSGANNYGVQITYFGGGGVDRTTVGSSGTTISDITIAGTGRGTGSSAVGVRVDTDALITTTGAGDIAITGTSSATGAGSLNRGVYLFNGADITSTSTGNITITGTAANTSGGNNEGVTIESAPGGSSVNSSGSGLITLDGFGRGTGNGGVGVVINGGLVTSLNGTIDIDGTSQATGAGTGNAGVLIVGNGDVISTGAAKIDITGVGAATGGAGGNNGIVVSGAGTSVDSQANDAAATITLTGNSFGTGGTSIGVVVEDSAAVKSVAGNVLITGTSNIASGATTDNYGVSVQSAALIETTGAAKVDIIGLSGITSGTNNYGVAIGGAGTIVRTSGTANSDITITGTGRGSDPAPASHGVVIETAALLTTTGAGDIAVTGLGSTATSFGNAVGIQVNGASVTATATGTITLDGTGGGTGAATDNIGVQVLGASLIQTTGDGKIDIIGQGGNANGINNYGVQITGSGTTVQNNGTATSLVTVDGTGGGTGTSAHGVVIDDGALVTATSAGNIAVTGLGSTATGLGNAVGIQVDGASVTATATGTITLTGTGGGTGAATDNVGVKLLGAANVLTTGDGKIDIIGQGGNTTGVNNYGVQITGALTTVENNGTATSLVTVDGTGGGTGISAFGVLIDTGALVTATAAGNIAVTGLGSTATTLGSAVGIQVDGASVTATATGTITLTGTGGGTGTATDNVGVKILVASTIETSGDATIDIIGQGGNASGVNNYGVQITGAGTTVETSGSATSIVTIDGTGGGTGTSAFGVLIDTGALVTTTGAGNVVVLGDGSLSGSGSAIGIQVDGASVTATSTGTLTLTGTGGGTGTATDNVGVKILGGSLIDTTGAGTTTITGTGGNTSGTGNHGVQVTNSGTMVTSSSSAIAVNGFGGGTGGDSVGVLVSDTALVGTATGSVTLTGIGAAAGANNFGVSMVGGTVESTSTGSLALIGTGGAGAKGISTTGGGNTIGSGTMTGEILLRSLLGTGMVSEATILNDGSAVVTLNADGGGGFTQTGGSIVSGGLRFLGSGTFDLPDPIAANAVTNIAGTLADTSAVNYVQAGSVNVASLTSYQDGILLNQTTSDGFNIAGAASSLSITSGGITQDGNAPIVVPGTTTLTDGTNNIVLNNPGNFFGTINVVSANDVTLGGTSIGLGDVNVGDDLTINAGTLTDSGTVIVPGLATFNVTGNMVLDSPNSDFNRVTFNVGGNAALTDVNDLVVNTSTIGGNLALTTGGSLNTTPFNIVTVGGTVTLTVGTGGLGTIHNDFHLNTDGTITLIISGFVPGSPSVSGFVINDGAGLLNLLPPTGLVRFNVVEFQPPTPVTAAMYVSKDYSEVSLDDITDLIYVTDDPAEQEYPGVRGRIGRLKNGADIHRDGGVRMPPGLVSSGGEKPVPDTGIEPVHGSRFLFRN